MLVGSPNSFLDDRSLLNTSTIRHNDCHLLVPESTHSKCRPCILHRSTLTVQYTRMESLTAEKSTPASHVNLRYMYISKNFQIVIVSCRFQPVSTLVDRLQQLRKQYTVLQKQLQRVKSKIAESIQTAGVVLDEQMSSDLSQSSNILETFPEGSFQRQQQMDALKKNPRNMRWHPLMIKWCLYLRHTYVIIISM